MRMTAKNLLLRVAPDTLLLWAKRIHYVRAVANFHEPDVKVVRNLVKPGQIVLDIGANVGWYTKVLSDLVGKNGCVYSYEPVSPTFELLLHCTRQLGLWNVVAINCAISDREGTAVMEVPSYRAGGDNFYQSRIADDDRRKYGRRTFQVETKRIDSLFDDSKECIAFIKCDVEGHELSVIKGAELVMRRCRPAWQIEIAGDLDDSSSTGFAVVRFMSELGYQAYWLDGKALRARRHGDRTVNYFLLTEPHLQILAEHGLRIAN